MAEQRRFAGLASRSQLMAANNLGTILQRSSGSSRFRKAELEIFDAYFEARQYEGMAPWDQSKALDGSFIPVRQRAPLIQMNFAKVLTARLAAKLVGSRTFPELLIEDDPDMEELIRTVKRVSRLKGSIVRPIQRMLVSGSVLIRFSLINGAYRIEHFLSKWVSPKFDALGNITFARIQYVFEDKEDVDPRTKLPRKKWFRLDLTAFNDISYNNPLFEEGSEPSFTVVETVEHNLGFVQAEWFKTADDLNTIDGPSIIGDVLGFIDELNYSISQSSTAVQYNQDPQLTLKGMDEEEVTKLIRSSFKAWSLGKNGEASFLEAGMSGVQAASELRDKIRLNIQDVARVILLDPEKIIGSAQSAKAMEVLHGPMVELIEELRPILEKSLTNLCLKMTTATLIQNQRGAQVPITIPPGFRPQSVTITVVWPEIFPMTMEDLQKEGYHCFICCFG